MRMATRKLLDRAFSGIGVFSILLMAGALLVVLVPILRKGSTAFVYRQTIEGRQLKRDRFERGSIARVASEREAAQAARAPVYAMLTAFRADMKAMSASERRNYREPFEELEKGVRELLGPFPEDALPVLVRKQYGQTRWDRALISLHALMQVEQWDYSGPSGIGVQRYTPRVEEFKGTSLEPLFGYLENHFGEMMLPRWTFYGGFLTDHSIDAHMFGGIGPEVLGTIYLAIGAMLFAVPLGVIASIYFCEYAREGRVLTGLRTCVSALAGVPSIVFGLFGLAFFINTIGSTRSAQALGVLQSKSVLAGALTLGLLILPTIIRASEEAIRAVPQPYKEASLALGAGKWHTVVTVILPAAMPGILTGMVISLGRAAGETAPIIFTAAVSVGKALGPLDTFRQPTPALSWNIYNLCTEHKAVDQIRHVQFGMVATLVVMVLLLNLVAVLLRARISRKLKG